MLEEDISNCDFVFFTEDKSLSMDSCYAVETENKNLFFFKPDNNTERRGILRALVEAAIPSRPAWGDFRPSTLSMPHGPGKGRALPVHHALNLLSIIEVHQRKFWVATSPSEEVSDGDYTIDETGYHADIQASPSENSLDDDEEEEEEQQQQQQ